MAMNVKGYNRTILGSVELTLFLLSEVPCYRKGRGKRRKADIGKQEHQPFRAGKDAHRGSPQSEVHQQSSSWRVEQKQVLQLLWLATKLM